MNLSKKTLVYSSIISAIIVALIVGYFVLMLPSLYVAYIKDSHYNSIIELQKGYMKTGSYENLEIKNPTGTFTVELPLSGDRIYFMNQFIRVTVEVQEQKLLDMLDKIRYYAKNPKEIENIDSKDFPLEEILDDLIFNKELLEDYPLKFTLEQQNSENIFKEQSSRFHVVEEDLFVVEANSSDGNNYYTSYIAMGLKENAIVVTFFPVMTPSINEIRPVVFQSLPMIVALALLLVLVLSQVFSRLIINPIIKLSNHAEFMREAKNLKLEPVSISGQDEISSLGESLNGLYQRIQESYQELEVKNKYLAEENKRQEIFLRSSSHQLKTPITAALLLVQGMINEVGKYKDVKAYLPQVKEQLQSMQRIVEDILYLNHCSQNLQKEYLMVSELLEECLEANSVQIEEKLLNIETEGYMKELETDRELLRKILDNLLSNAIKFTPIKGRIHIRYDVNRLRIINYGASIEEELLPHIFEPFVTGADAMIHSSSYSNTNRSHGLGLYVVAYYAKLLNLKVKLYNIEHGVVVELTTEESKN